MVSVQMGMNYHIDVFGRSAIGPKIIQELPPGRFPVNVWSPPGVYCDGLAVGANHEAGKTVEGGSGE